MMTYAASKLQELKKPKKMLLLYLHYALTNPKSETTFANPHAQKLEIAEGFEWRQNYLHIFTRKMSRKNRFHKLNVYLNHGI